MRVKRRALPEGWYPSSPAEVKAEIAEWTSRLPPSRAGAAAGILPHAGWYFSGAYAHRVLAELKAAETVVILGGHLGEAHPLLVQDFDAFETPLGNVESDLGLLGRVKKAFSPVPDEVPDNTVEVQLPLVKALHPESRVACFRVPPSNLAADLGEFLASLRREGLDFVLVASTDLTHYGPNYGFHPRGTGAAALDWVRNENDAGFLDAVKALDVERILASGVEAKAACSAGAAATAAAFAKALGLEAELLAYGTSCQKHPSPSFVGYGALVFR